MHILYGIYVTRKFIDALSFQAWMHYCDGSGYSLHDADNNNKKIVTAHSSIEGYVKSSTFFHSYPKSYHDASIYVEILRLSFVLKSIKRCSLQELVWINLVLSGIVFKNNT